MWERIVLLAHQQEAGEIPFVPTISSVLRILNRHCPNPRVKLYRLNATLCQPLYICPILGVRAHWAEARIGGCTIIALLDFDGRGAAFSILEFLCFASKELGSCFGVKIFFLKKKERVYNDRSDAKGMMKQCIDCNGVSLCRIWKYSITVNVICFVNTYDLVLVHCDPNLSDVRQVVIESTWRTSSNQARKKKSRIKI
jgi:hypothetical protein